MLWNLIKSDCNNLYLHNKSFKTTLKSNSHLTSIFRCGPVNSSSPTFPNINLIKTTTNLLAVWKITEKGCNVLHVLPKVHIFFYDDAKMIFLTDILCNRQSSWSGVTHDTRGPHWQCKKSSYRWLQYETFIYITCTW